MIAIIDTLEYGTPTKYIHHPTSSPSLSRFTPPSEQILSFDRLISSWTGELSSSQIWCSFVATDVASQ